MGFWDAVGEGLGKMAAKGQELQRYKHEYEYMSDDDLKREFKRLKARGGSEANMRSIAVASVLGDRGYHLRS